jgi:Lantibiotic dehydratase, N terminus
MEICQVQTGTEITGGVTKAGIMPYAVIRRAGTSSAHCQRLVFSRSLAIIDKCLDLEALCKRQASPLLASLEAIIGAVPLPEVRLEFIHLRRAIFNDRLPKKELSASAKAVTASAFSSVELDALESWLTSRRQREELMQQGERTFSDELSVKRKLLKNLFRNLEFRKGLTLASPTLCYELEQYLQAPEGVAIPRLARTERALIRYYSRCAFKLSPFSSFTRTGLTRLPVDTDRETGTAKTGRMRIRRKPVINRALIGDLAHCIARHPELRGDVPIFASRTFAKKDQTLLVVRHRHTDRDLIRRRRKNGERDPVRMRVPEESFVGMSQSGAMRWIMDFLESRGGVVQRNELTSALASSLNDIPAASAYVDGLVELGLLVQKVPMPEDDSNGLKALNSFLAGISSVVVTNVRQSLDKLDALAQRFAKAGPAARLGLLRNMGTVVEDAYRALGIDPPHWDGLLLYEDCVEEPISTFPDTEEWIPALEDLSGFLSYYSFLLDGNISARETIRHILRTEFSGGPVSLLHLAQRYNKLCSASPPGGQGAEGSYTPNPLGLSSLAELAEIRREFGSVIVQDSEVEKIDLEAVAKQKCWPERIRLLRLALNIGAVACTSCYCQPAGTSSGSNSIVLNKIHAGPARPVLRVCNSLSDDKHRAEFLKEIPRMLKHVWRQAEPCEMLATFDFNINLRPLVTKRAINYGNDPSIGPDGIELGNLFVRLDTCENIVVTEGVSSRHEIVPVNFGMMATPFEPPLDYLLLCLGTADPVIYKPFDPYSWDLRREGQRTVIRFPRLSFGRCILRRLGWSVLREGLPQRDSKESDFAYFLRVRRWQRQLELPDEVFARARTFKECLPRSDEPANHKSRNLFKPQYIHFGNYFLADILGGLFKETSTQLYIEEMLPEWSSLKNWKLQRPVEFVVDACVESGSASFDISESSKAVACESAVRRMS